MTPTGIVHLSSAIYLMFVFCLAVSVNENRRMGRILRETGRRWAKFAGVCLITGLAVYLIS